MFYKNFLTGNTLEVKCQISSVYIFNFSYQINDFVLASFYSSVACCNIILLGTYSTVLW